MPDTKVSALTDGTTAVSTDRIPVARDAGGGTFNNRYVTPGYIGTTLLGSGTALTGSTVTTSSPVLNLTQTWNDGNVTFTGLKFNAAGSSDANSAAGSLLLDLQIGASSRLSVDKNGRTTLNSGTGGFTTGSIFKMTGKAVLSGSAGDGPGAAWVLGYNSSASNNVQHWFGPANGIGSASYKFFRMISVNSNSVVDMIPGDGAGNSIPVAFAAGIAWVDGSFNTDTYLTRGTSSAQIQLGAADTTGTTAPTPQFLRVQSWSSSTNNNQIGADFTIQGSRGTGTGAGGSIIFQVAPAGSSGTAQNAYATAAVLTGAGIWDINSAITSGFQINNGATLLFYANTSNVVQIGGNGLMPRTDGGPALGSAPTGGFSGGWANLYLHTNAAIRFNNDTILARDDSNTLALRNGGTSGTPVPQRFNIYNYWASASDYERLSLFFNSNNATIFVDKAGSGSYRDLVLQGYGNIRFLPGNLSFLDLSPTTMSFADAINIAFGTTTGTKIGTATNQMIGFWNATPIVQPTTGVAEAAFVENSGGTAVNVDSTFGGYTLQQVVKALQNAGLLA